MRKRIIVLFTIACLVLTGCEGVEVTTTPSVSTVQMEYSDFDLIMDQKTGIVYIDNTIATFDDSWKHYNHVYTPYYGKNGKLCRFVDGKVVEVE